MSMSRKLDQQHKIHILFNLNRYWVKKENMLMVGIIYVSGFVIILLSSKTQGERILI